MAETYQKLALTFDEQVQLIQKHDLVINDHNHVLSQLSTINYYCLSAYWYLFRIRNQHGKVTKNSDSWCQQCNELIEPFAPEGRWCTATGMPDNWKEHPIWK